MKSGGFWQWNTTGLDMPSPVYGLVLSAFWLLPVFLYWLIDRYARLRRRTVAHASSVVTPVSQEIGMVVSVHAEGYDDGRSLVSAAEDMTVLFASLEHSLPHRPQKQAVAGGLGKVVDLIARHHPSDIVMVHPMLRQRQELQALENESSIYYGNPSHEEFKLRIKVDGTTEEIKVFRHTFFQKENQDTGEQRRGHRVTFLFLSHALFEARTRESIYPNPMSKRTVLAFFSLWNQAVGELLVRYKPRVFHCPDFHTAIAPWYTTQLWPRLRILLVLHNAEYQGQISTDMIRGDRLKSLASIFNLPEGIVRKHLVHDGRFNMLKAAVDFVVERQQGLGVCAVSRQYAAECYASHSLFWHLPRIEGLDNPMLEDERDKTDRTSSKENLAAAKASAKRDIQNQYSLNADENARLFVCLGRLVRQKGVDLLADIADWLLTKFDNSQLVVIGPVGDGFGCYAAAKLERLAREDRFRGRIYVWCKYMRVPDDLKFATDFCLMPSRDEPFGYVDVEFAWRGALLVGAQAGGLGKVPGFYYVAQNRENLGRLKRELRRAISEAMSTSQSQSQLDEMAFEATKCEFSLGMWQKRLQSLYKIASEARGKHGLRRVDTRAFITHSDTDGGLASDVIRTFKPFDDVPRTKVPSAPILEDDAGPPSMIDVAAERQVEFTGVCAWSSGPENEFITQELDEAELSKRVEEKLSQTESKTIDVIMESIGSEVDKEREQGRVTRWLLGQTFGTARIHLVVCCGYVMSPIASFFTYIIATEWGIRGASQLPGFIMNFSWATRVFGQQGVVDVPVLNILLFTVNCLSFALGVPIWAALSMWISPRLLLAASFLLQGPFLFAVLPINPTISKAVALVFFQGLVTSSSLLFIVFSFMMSIKADMSRAALRMGLLEMLRCCVNWLLMGYAFCSSPSSVQGTETDPIPFLVTLKFIPLAVVVLLTSLIPGILCLFAPGSYRDDRFPKWELDLIFKRPSFLIFGISDCVGCLALFPSTCYISWWIANGWTDAELGVLSILLALFLALGAGLWGWVLSQASVHGFSVLIAVALLVAPAPMIRAIAMEEVSSIIYVGHSFLGLFVCVVSLFFEGMRSSALWAVKIKILGSRWRVLSYGTLLLLCCNICAAASPFLCEYLARRAGSSFITRNQKELADAAVVCLVPLGVFQFVLQVAAAPVINEDIGIMQIVAPDPCQQRFRRAPVVFSCLACLVMGIILWLMQVGLVGRPLQYYPIHGCDEHFNFQSCKQIRQENDHIYSKNEYHQETTGLYHCARRMHELQGNTIVFSADEQSGVCQVFTCGNEDESASWRFSLKKTPLESPMRQLLEEGQVWSKLCTMSGQNLVAVHLFEWRWSDVAAECDSLGSVGFNVVQVSPPAEHIRGDSWSNRYQPTSYSLNSRAGDRNEFINMVSRCRSAGVSVMVDAVLNHMAGPYVQVPASELGKECGHTQNTSKFSKEPCVGWTGTQFGNRAFPKGTPGKDNYEPADFHHYPGNVHGNCGLPPWTNNRHLCDLLALPDLNTESTHVQLKLIKYLLDLYEIGVTMLRIDAAAHMYPESLAAILHPIPWSYVVQEYYPLVLKSERETLRKAMEIGSATDFVYGQLIAESIFDSWDKKSHSWNDRSKYMYELLSIHRDDGSQEEGFEAESCPYSVCASDSALSSSNSLIFLDNHDQQRERWKSGPLKMAECDWDGKDIGSCRPIYKHGAAYNLAMQFMLAWPYGDAVRIMSSFAFSEYRQGPPGVQRDSSTDSTSSVYPNGCKGTPETSPVTAEWENSSHQWICEHKWDGVAGLVRFRRLVGAMSPRPSVHNTWSDKFGRIAFSLDNIAFVALSRGYNWVTGFGKNSTWNLTGRQTKLPPGIYCNLARGTMAIKEADKWLPQDCAADLVNISENGTVLHGEVQGGKMLAIHVNYSNQVKPLSPPSLVLA